jgi:predicted nucleic acid-binding protein
MHGISRVLADANLLYSRTLRDWLFLLKFETTTGMYSVCSTEDILSEVLYSYRRNNPTINGQATSNLRKLLEASIDDFISVFDGSVPNPFLDVNDSHLHAVAVSSSIDILLTCDTGLLSVELATRDVLPYEVMHPDDFFLLIDDSAPHVVKSVTAKQVEYWESRQAGANERRGPSLVEALTRAGCPKFGLRVKGHLKNLAGAFSE